MLEIEVIFSQFFDTELFDKVKFFYQNRRLPWKCSLIKNEQRNSPPPLQLLYTSPRSYVLL